MDSDEMLFKQLFVNRICGWKLFQPCGWINRFIDASAALVWVYRKGFQSLRAFMLSLANADINLLAWPIQKCCLNPIW